MTGYEHETQEVVAHVVVESLAEIQRGPPLLGLELVAEFLVLALKPLVSAQEINRTMLRSGHQPGARVVRDSRLGPLLEPGDESVLCEILSKTKIAHDPHETGDEPRRLDSPDRVDRAMGIGTVTAIYHTIFKPSAQDRGVSTITARERSLAPRTTRESRTRRRLATFRKR
jgi:hypothetical protein